MGGVETSGWKRASMLLSGSVSGTEWFLRVLLILPLHTEVSEHGFEIMSRGLVSPHMLRRSLFPRDTRSGKAVTTFVLLGEEDLAPCLSRFHEEKSVRVPMKRKPRANKCYFRGLEGDFSGPVDGRNPLQYDDFPHRRALSSAG